MKPYNIWGAVFILAAGILYTIERAVSILSTSNIKAGFYAGRMTGAVPEVEAGGLFKNPFVPIFLAIGIGLIVYAFMNRNR